MSRRDRSSRQGTPYRATPAPRPTGPVPQSSIEDDIQTLQTFVRSLGTDAPVAGAARRIVQALRAAQASKQPTSSQPPALSIEQIKHVVQTEANRTIKEIKAAAPSLPRSYADAARQPASASAVLEARVPLRAMREITIKPGGETPEQRLRTGQDIVREVSAAIGATNVVLAARRLPSGDVTLSFDTEQSRSTWENRLEIRQVFGDNTAVRTKGYAVLVHGLNMALLDTTDQQAAARTIITENPQWNGQVTIERMVWTARARKDPSRPGSLVLVLATPAQANLVVRDGVLFMNEYHRVDIYSEDCRVMRCFKCQRYHRTIGNRCRNEIRCGFCAGTHDTNDCIAKDAGKGAACVPCGRSGHPAWARDCPCRANEVRRARDAYVVRPTRYQEQERSTPAFCPPPGSRRTCQFPSAGVPSTRFGSSADEEPLARKRGRPSTVEKALARTAESIERHFRPSRGPGSTTLQAAAPTPSPSTPQMNIEVEMTSHE
jgi:hypothetical protein